MTVDSKRSRRAVAPASRWAMALDNAAWVALGATVAGWLIGLLLLARQRIIITHDSVSNYAHVWYVSQRLWHGHGLPLRMPSIGHGAAFAFPYAVFPWSLAALFWPLLGDRATTLALVGGTLGLLIAQFWALPELRGRWLAAAALVEPVLVAAPLEGQLPFIWATALLLAAIGCWRRERRGAASLLMAAAQITHPAVVLPIAGLLVLAWLPWERERRALLVCYALATVLTLPAIALVFASPVMSDASRAVVLENFFVTVGVRAFIIIVPLGLVTLRRARAGWQAAALLGLLAINVLVLDPMNTRYAWGALTRAPDTRVLPFLASPAFVPDAMYRVLSAHDAKMAMYQTLRRGGRLDSEFFPESIGRRSWDTPAAYSAFLRGRHVEYVIVFEDYAVYHTNEHALLDQLAAAAASCGATSARVEVIQRLPDYDVYAIDRGCAIAQRPQR